MNASSNRPYTAHPRAGLAHSSQLFVLVCAGVPQGPPRSQRPRFAKRARFPGAPSTERCIRLRDLLVPANYLFGVVGWICSVHARRSTPGIWRLLSLSDWTFIG